MTKCSVIILLLAILLTTSVSCSNDDSILNTVTPNCEGRSMPDIWTSRDSITNLLEDSSRIQIEDYFTFLYENGTGKENSNPENEYFYFQWGYQCDPDFLTFTFLPEQRDSSFPSSLFYKHQRFDVDINDMNYKKLFYRGYFSDTTYIDIVRELWRN